MAGELSTTSGASTRGESTFRISDEIFAAKDWSKDPSDNTDRAKKLGNQQPSRVGIIIGFDAGVHRRFLQDGLNSGSEDATFFFEPDNLCYRKHIDGGQEIDRVWAFRVICDHNEKHNEKENRSTFIVDQRNKQHQGTHHEIFWIKDVGAKSSQPETLYTGAGEWAGIGSGTPTEGDSPKYHTCANIYKKAGYVTDGEKIAQFKHLFKIIEFTADTPTGAALSIQFPCTSVPFDIEDESAEGARENLDGDKYGELALWSDILFYQDENKKGPLGIDPVVDDCPKGRLRFGGFLWSNRKGGKSDQIFSDPKNPDNGKSEESMEDSPAFGRKTRLQWLRPWILVANTTVPTSPPTPPPSAFPSLVAGTRTPTATVSGAFRGLNYSAAGTPVATWHVVEVPDDTATGDGMNVAVEFLTPAGGGMTRNVTLNVKYIVVSLGSSGAPGALTGTLTNTITSAGNPGTQTLYRSLFFIPSADIVTAKGGKIAYMLERPADVGGQDFFVVNHVNILGSAL